MADLRERFIELALRPLAGKTPVVEVARGELMERLNHSRPGPKDDSLEMATARLETAVGRFRIGGMQALLMLLAFTALLGAVSYSSWKDLLRIDHFYNVIPGDIRGSDRLKAAERELETKVPDDQRLFLFANSRTMGEALRGTWRQRSEERLPDDPAWLEEYVVAYGFRNRTECERTLGQARRIDGENGFWDLREAGVWIGRSTFKYSNSKPRSGFGPAFPILTTDDAYEEAVALMEKAVLAPQFETRIPSRLASRLEMLGPASDLAEVADRRMFAWDQLDTGRYTNRWGELWAARTEELARGNDRNGLREWFTTFERLLARCLRESGDKRLFNPNEMVGVRSLRNFQDVLRRFDLNDEVARIDHWIEELQKPISKTPDKGVQGMHQKLSASSGVGYYPAAAFIHESELEPGRRAEHAAADRMLATAVAILFGILAWLAGLEGWRRAQPVGGLADGVGALLRRSDFAWICALGIALPSAWHVVIAGISPLGCRDYGIGFEDAKPIALRAAGSFLFAACMLVQSARWRLAERGGLLGFRSPLWQGWAIAVVAALFVPTMGAVRYLPKWQEEFINFGSAAAGMPLLWLLWRSFALVLSPRRAALHGVMVCRTLSPCFIAASLVLLASAYLLKREESKWVRCDPLVRFDPGGSGMSVGDARMIDALRDRMLRAIDSAPAAK